MQAKPKQKSIAREMPDIFRIGMSKVSVRDMVTAPRIKTMTVK